MCILQDWYRQCYHCRVLPPKRSLPQRYWNWSYLTEFLELLVRRVFLLNYVGVFFKLINVLDETTVHKRNKFHQEWMFPFFWAFSYSFWWIKLSFESNSVCENLFLTACFCWNDRIFSCEMDQKFDWITSYGHSYLGFIFCHPKVFRLHAIVHEGAGAMRSHTGKRPGYCCMTGQRPNSFAWWSDYTTIFSSPWTLYAYHLQFCELLKQYILYFTWYWACRENQIKELGGFLMGMFRDTHFVLQRCVNQRTIILI